MFYRFSLRSILNSKFIQAYIYMFCLNYNAWCLIINGAAFQNDSFVGICCEIHLGLDKFAWRSASLWSKGNLAVYSHRIYFFMSLCKIIELKLKVHAFSVETLKINWPEKLKVLLLVCKCFDLIKSRRR